MKKRAAGPLSVTKKIGQCFFVQHFADFYPEITGDKWTKNGNT
jgi:hypothetical protein